MTQAWFLPKALSDIRAAARWYEAQEHGLGDAFVSAIEQAVTHVLAYPRASLVVHRRVRRHLVDRFPYCLYYRVEGEGIVVIALLHAALDPASHRGRAHRG